MSFSLKIMMRKMPLISLDFCILLILHPPLFHQLGYGILKRCIEQVVRGSGANTSEVAYCSCKWKDDLVKLT